MSEADIINCSCSHVSHIPGVSAGAGKYGVIDDESELRSQYDTIASCGRDRKGVIFVFAAGNQRLIGGDTNYCNVKSSPHVIVVGGIEKANDLALAEKPFKPFSNPGANILISAPANFIPTLSTGVTNEYGHYFVDRSMHATGTSYAAPIVSAAIAMMLEVNPALSLSDVKKILAYSGNALASSTKKDLH